MRRFFSSSETEWRKGLLYIYCCCQALWAGFFFFFFLCIPSRNSYFTTRHSKVAGDIWAGLVPPSITSPNSQAGRQRGDAMVFGWDLRGSVLGSYREGTQALASLPHNVRLSSGCWTGLCLTIQGCENSFFVCVRAACANSSSGSKRTQNLFMHSSFFILLFTAVMRVQV